MLYLIKKYRFLFIILSLVIIGICLVYLLGGIGEEEYSEDLSSAGVITSPAESEAGEIGDIKIKDEETGKENSLVTPIIPQSIFSTAGIIVEVKTDALIITGEGTNFADNIPRNLTCIFTDETLTFEKNQLQYYKGGQGLK